MTGLEIRYLMVTDKPLGIAKKMVFKTSNMIGPFPPKADPPLE